MRHELGDFSVMKMECKLYDESAGLSNINIIKNLIKITQQNNDFEQIVLLFIDGTVAFRNGDKLDFLNEPEKFAVKPVSPDQIIAEKAKAMKEADKIAS